MDDEKRKEFIRKYRNICLKLNGWLQLKSKDFGFKEALSAIYDAANGKESVMVKMIEQLTEKDKTRGRSQVYHTDSSQHMDIVRNDEGNIVVIGFSPDKEARPKGMKSERNPNIFRKSDGQVKKTVKRTEDRLGDIGKEARELFPDADVDFLEKAIKAIGEFAAKKKKKPIIIINRIKNGVYTFDKNTFEIKPKTNEGRVIVISEEVLNKITNNLIMTDYVFESNIRQFLSDLYNDPVNAQPSDVLRVYNLNRNRLIRLLIDYGIITKKEKVSFKDENGNFKTPTMKVRYGIKDEVGDFEVKKKHFQMKIRNLYIDLFEKNVPKKINEEDGGGGFISGGGDGAGQYSTVIFGSPVKQKSYSEKTKEINEITDSGVNQTYDMPAFSDKETRDRKGGKNHSVSINFK